MKRSFREFVLLMIAVLSFLAICYILYRINVRLF